MRKTIKLLDLCCKAGGCSMGYFQAANELGIKIEITGIDIEPQPNYPFKFIKADAVAYLAKHGHKFTHIHASPPCQAYSAGTAEMRAKGKVYPDILAEIREGIQATGNPGIIENVSNAPMRLDLILKGHMFGLKVIRKRLFEFVNFFMLAPQIPQLSGSVKGGDFVCVFGKGSYGKVKHGGQKPKWAKSTVRETWAYAMGIDWMKNTNELAEAIPPAYTKYIGLQLFAPMASTRKKRVAPAKL